MKPLLAAIEDQRVRPNCRGLAIQQLRDAPRETLKITAQKAISDPAPGVRRAAEEVLARIKDAEAKEELFDY